MHAALSFTSTNLVSARRFRFRRKGARIWMNTAGASNRQPNWSAHFITRHIGGRV
jgi:hypothetical protein